MSKATGVQIIGTAGFNKGFLWNAKCRQERTYKEWIDSATEDELTQFIIDEVEVGMQGTGVRAGQVKSARAIIHQPAGNQDIRAACRAHLATGARCIRTRRGTMGLEQLKYIREEGVDPHNVSFGHMDRNPDRGCTANWRKRARISASTALPK
ncbi:MAG: hypothetical protein V8Q88_03910 [Christensenellales bacterium]